MGQTGRFGFFCLLTSVYKTEWLPAASEGWVCYCINSIIVGRGEASTAGHIKTPHTWAWLLAVQGTFTVNMDSQFNENCFSWAIAERDHGQIRACVQIMAQIPNRVVIIAINPGTPRPCADSLISSCLQKVLSSLCHSCFPSEIHLKPSPSVFLYRRWSH